MKKITGFTRHISVARLYGQHSRANLMLLNPLPENL